MRNRLAARHQHFERAQDALSVARLERRRPLRIACGQHRMQRLGPFLRQPRPQRQPQFLRNLRHLGKPARQRLEIKARAADEDRRFARSTDRGDLGLYSPQPGARGIGRVRRHMAIKPVLDPTHLGLRGPGRDNTQRVIDLHAVGIDHDAIDSGRPIERQRGLAAGRRAGYQDRVVFAHKVVSMALVATLIANPQNPVLVPALGEKAAAAVSASGLYWLADGIACDIALKDGTDAAEAMAALTAAVDGAPVDIVIQQAETRRKKLLIADMDSTMIGQECIDELAAEVGLKDLVAAITARAMNGEIEFEPALRERVALLKGLPVNVVDEVIAKRITLTPGGKELIDTMTANGGYTALVSGGFTVFTGRIASVLGFHENRANVLIEEDGKLAGIVAEPILGKQAKVDALLDITETLGIQTDDAIAVGDGANDLGMLQLAGSGVALHAKPSVAAQAKMRIDHGDLTALLYIQGYRKRDFR